MYASFFGLNEKPFSITPDPRYLFLSERHGEALAHLVYGVTESGGFIQLTGEVGTGKTTLVPLVLRDAPWLGGRKILILEPRRPAARMAAYRMAALLGEDVGQSVGYRVRFDTRVSSATRIEVVTEVGLGHDGALLDGQHLDGALAETGKQFWVHGVLLVGGCCSVAHPIG